uniref:ABC transporter domain-containing protein n=1 Tax=Brassica oleracea var. oleracea TaxID=109376 RepID=A0A0D3DC26_BRAOL
MKRDLSVEEENMCTSLLTAFVVLSMACLKHFYSVSYLIEKWRSLVFLLLNVVLLAVYFTSTRPISCETRDLKTRRGSRMRMVRRKTRKTRMVEEPACSGQDFLVVEPMEVIKNCVVEETKRVCPEFEETVKGCLLHKKEVESNGEEDDFEPGRLSNEELNERVEAFITTFRKHLVLDARRGRYRETDQKMRSKDSDVRSRRMMIPTSFSSITRLLLNDVGGSSIGDETFMQAISKNVVALLSVACASWVICFLGISYAIWGFMTWYGSRMVMEHGAKGGTIFAFIVSISFGGTSLGQGLSNLKYFSEEVVAAESITKVVNRVPDIDSDNLKGQILGELKEKCNLIFDDFCLRVPSGKTVALVGGSGSGKSTVISLFAEILLDGVPINKLQVKWLRSQMGLVSQEPLLFATSIEENILFGKENATMDEVVEAAKASNAHTFISQFPHGYKTQVGERGVQMSGGQKQRIAIIKSPKMLLLDEATSALDSESERVVQEALDNASVGRTTIVIAHRLSTIRNADVICVVHNGRIVESGSHKELMENLDGQSLQENIKDSEGKNLGSRWLVNSTSTPLLISGEAMDDLNLQE